MQKQERNMKEVAVKETNTGFDDVHSLQCLWGGSSCVMTPLLLTSDVLLTQALSWESVRLVLNKLRPRFLLLFSLLFLCPSVICFLISHDHIAVSTFTSVFGCDLFFKTSLVSTLFQGVQLWDLLVHTQPLHCLLHHPHGAHGRVGFEA